METKKFLALIAAIVAIGITVIVAIRTVSQSGKVKTSEAHAAIEQASQQHVADQSRVPPSSDAPKGVVTTLPGNKGRRGP